MRSCPDFMDLLIILGAESKQDTMQALFLMNPGLRKLLIADIRNGKKLPHVRSGQLFQCASIRHDMNPSANKEEAYHSPCRWIADHFVNTHLVGSRTTFQEEVVQ